VQSSFPSENALSILSYLALFKGICAELKVVAADSGSAVLDEVFTPQKIVSTSSICTDVPYRMASNQISDLLMSDVKRHDLVVTELRMCRKMLQLDPAETVHLDMSLGGISVSQLTASDLQEMAISSKARQRIRHVLPQLRKLATDIEREFNVEVLALGKESLPVRIAELTAGACSVIHAAKEALKQRRTLLLGLPSLCTVSFSEDRITARSLRQGEFDIAGYAEDGDGVVRQVKIGEFNNPKVRGFRVLRIETSLNQTRSGGEM